MAKMSKQTGDGIDRSPAADAGSAPRERSGDRPPESAEDFGHVLRRLISGKNLRSDRAGEPESNHPRSTRNSPGR